MARIKKKDNNISIHHKSNVSMNPADAGIFSTEIRSGVVVIQHGQSIKTNIDDDEDLDKRVKFAVRSEINRAKVRNKPVAKYDIRKKKAYLQFPNGEKKYVN